MGFIIAILVELYVELMLLIVPEKNKTQKLITCCKVLAGFVILAMFALVILGAVLIIDYQNLSGILPISVAAVLSLAQIILGIVFYKKNH